MLHDTQMHSINKMEFDMPFNEPETLDALSANVNTCIRFDYIKNDDDSRNNND